MSRKVTLKPGEKIDSFFRYIVRATSLTIIDKNDDATFFVTGLTGSGKSSLVCYAYEEFVKCSKHHNVMNVDSVGFTIPQYASSLKWNKDSFPKGHRFSWNDEANITKHSVLSKANKDLLDLKFSIRGMGYMDWWCNPSADILQKEFVKEVIKGLFFVFTKNTDGRPRKYYYFTRSDLVDFFDKYKSLENNLLLKFGSRFASYQGEFLKYDGKFWDEYVLKKESRMEDKVDAFAGLYNDNANLFDKTKVASMIGVHTVTITKYHKEALESDFVVEGQDFILVGTRVKYTLEGVEKLKKIMLDNQNKQNRALEKSPKRSR
jgi:hypothetical protein